MPPAIAAYPWGHLARVPRAVARAARAARPVLRRIAGPGLEGSLRDLLGADAALALDTPVAAAPPAAGDALWLESAEGGVVLGLVPSPGLVVAVLERVLHRRSPPAGPAGPPGGALSGALAAVAVEVARRSGAERELRALPAAPDRLPEAGLSATATVLLADRPYTASVWAGLRHGAEAPTPTASDVALPVALRVVVAASLAPGADMEGLRGGDVWMPGGGAWVGRPGEAPFRAALAADGSRRGVSVECSRQGSLVLEGSLVALAPGAEVDMAELRSDLDEAVLDAPVLVRVEVGSVTLTGREWAALRPGDVIETGVRIAEPVVLRVGDREVGRGELVAIDGELGVRVLETA